MLKNIFTTHIFKNPSTVRVFTARNMSSEANDVIIESVKDKGIITLNRPKALNALNLSMVKKILPVLTKWENEKTMVLVKGMGEKSFCAGGDVKSIALAGMRGERLGHEFFKYEYTMNGVIGTYKIPYIAFIDGITMGGGVGLSVHGQYRVATERTIFAMPETQIGLFPDVGGSYFLPRLGGKLGLYLALTGHRLVGHDVLKAGIATHYVDSRKIPELQKTLMDCGNEDNIKDVLNRFSEKDIPPFTLAPYLRQIDEIFSAPTLEDIMDRLESDQTTFSLSTLNLLKKMSPTSMKVSKKLLDRGIHLSLLECLEVEYRVAVGTLANKDFYEGVRALLIDKDQKPKWSPAKLEEVSNDLVESHFSKLPDDQELRHKL